MLDKEERVWIDNHFDTLRREIVKLQVDVAALKVKASIWGIIGGSIPVIITIAMYLVIKGL